MKRFPELNVLLLDDEENMRKYILELLKEFQFKNIFEGDNGEDGFRTLMDNKVDLIISDWLMPTMNGVELFDSIKSNPGFSEIPFILLTSVREKEQVVKAAGAGIRHYVIKPVDPNSLRDKILSCLD